MIIRFARITPLLIPLFIFLSFGRVFAELPPRPEPPAPVQHTPTDQSDDDIEGAKIILTIPMSTPLPINQASWTQVQWQDVDDQWHDVSGWAGTFTLSPDHQSWEVEWWVDKEHFGDGPFRWQIEIGKTYKSPTIYSAEFLLPNQINEVKTITLLD